jgi:hypothetical protein
MYMALSKHVTHYGPRSDVRIITWQSPIHQWEGSRYPPPGGELRTNEGLISGNLYQYPELWRQIRL